MQKSIRILTQVTVIAFVFSALTSLASAESDPIGFKVRYGVFYGDLEIGSSKRRIVQGAEGNTESEHQFQARGILKLLGEKSYTQNSVLQIVGTEVVPMGYEVLGESDQILFDASFDWTNREVTLTDGRRVGLPSHPVFDLESWYVSLMVGQPDRLEDQTITIIERDKRRTYMYKTIEAQQIDVKGETVDAVHFRLQDVKDERRRYEVWVTPGFHNLPVRIDKIRKNQTVSFKMKAFEWVYPQ